MKFENLKQKCEYYRKMSDYKLIPNSYVICMLDGRAFSHLIKNKYEKPFDDTFINIMNETAKYLLKNIQGAKFGYVQSDEISILITDFDTPESDAFFGYRLCKMQSVIASMAASKFNQLQIINDIKARSYKKTLQDGENTLYSVEDAVEYARDAKLVEFDCKCWNVPNANEAFAHFLWRQNDCVRNSKQQAAQTYLPHKDLVGLTTDEQIRRLFDRKDIDWAGYDDGKKYGRLIYKEPIRHTTTIKGEVVDYVRNEFIEHGAKPFAEDSVIRGLIP